MSRGSTRNAYHGGEGALLGSCEGRQRFETLLSEVRVFSMKDLSWPARQPPRTFLFRFLNHFTLSILTIFFYIFMGHSIFKGRLGTGIYHSYNESRKIGAEEGLRGIIKITVGIRRQGESNKTYTQPRCYCSGAMTCLLCARLLDLRVAVGGSLFYCRGPGSQKRVCLSSACS